MAALHKSYHDQGKNNVKKVRPGTDRRQPRKVKLDWLIIKKSTADLLVMLKYAKKGPGEYGIGGIHDTRALSGVCNPSSFQFFW